MYSCKIPNSSRAIETLLTVATLLHVLSLLLLPYPPPSPSSFSLIPSFSPFSTPSLIYLYFVFTVLCCLYLFPCTFSVTPFYQSYSCYDLSPSPTFSWFIICLFSSLFFLHAFISLSSTFFFILLTYFQPFSSFLCLAESLFIPLIRAYFSLFCICVRAIARFF